jgi:hypothetical protein
MAVGHPLLFWRAPQTRITIGFTIDFFSTGAYRYFMFSFHFSVMG